MRALYVLGWALGGWGLLRGSEPILLAGAGIAAAAAWNLHAEALVEGRTGRLAAFILVPTLAGGILGFPSVALAGIGAAAAAWRLGAIAHAALLATTQAGTTAIRDDAEAEARLAVLARQEAEARGRLNHAVELSRALRAVLASSSADETLSALNAAARRLGLPGAETAFARDGSGFRPTFTPTTDQEYAVQALIGQARLAVLRSGRMEQLREIGRTDWLTGLPNRRALDEALPVEQRRAASLGLKLSYAMIDIDHFKRFNDTHGHAVGDAVLMAVAKQLREVARKSDFVARYGGEEFALILPESSVDAAALLAERMQRHLLENPTRPHGHMQPLPVTVSIGISSKDLEHADKALYAAKQNGRNRVEVA